ncbi:MAG: glycosyltransferase family 2 protein [Candidatus Aenigmarchaeota archaeon]|nr:glycosyltransferase family 2 protein [Candidatus Aenigmarchaeota archaeon]
MKKYNASLVILTKNEIKGLKTILDKIPINTVKDVFAVDAKSTDGTIEFLRSKNVPVVIQRKMGRGEAFRIACKVAKYENVVFFSPDGNESQKDIPILLYWLEKGYDMVIASRFMKGSRSDDSNSLIPYRSFGNKFFTHLVNLFFHGNLTDSLNGFRALKKKAFFEINPDAEGFGIEFQMSIRALKKKLKIKEIPTYEGDRIGGKSTAHAVPTGIYFLKLFWRELKNR